VPFLSKQRYLNLRFENFWLEHEQFNEVFKESSELHSHKRDPAQNISAKLKRTRKTLKDWQNNLPRLATTIDNTKLVIQFIDTIEVDILRCKSGISETF
jgi:hypothetical protein